MSKCSVLLDVAQAVGAPPSVAPLLDTVVNEATGDEVKMRKYRISQELAVTLAYSIMFA